MASLLVMAHGDGNGSSRTVIEAAGLVKHFGGTHALRGLDLRVEAGTVLGLLGPNGAGKTTLIRILSTLERPDGGYARVDGCDVVRQSRRVRRAIGLTGQYTAVDEDISGRENLYMVARLLNLRPRDARARADELLRRFDLVEAARRPASGYSGGMRRRLDLAASLVGRPSVLFLDEPTTGLDPHSRNALWRMVRAMVDEGVTVLLTTQYMDEAEALADTVAVMRSGRVIASGPTAELCARVGGRLLQVRPADPRDLAVLVEALTRADLRPVTGGEDGGAVLRVPIGDDRVLSRALAVVTGCGLPVSDVVTRVPSLDEVFLRLTGPDGGGSGAPLPAEAGGR